MFTQRYMHLDSFFFWAFLFSLFVPFFGAYFTYHMSIRICRLSFCFCFFIILFIFT